MDKIEMSCKDAEFDIDIEDSLRRQITEKQKILKEEKNNLKAKELELRRKVDQNKASQVLNSLKLKKQSQDLHAFLEESRKQWVLDLKHTINSVEQAKIARMQNQMESLKIISKIYEFVEPLPVSSKFLDVTQLNDKFEDSSSFNQNSFEMHEEPTVEKIKVSNHAFKPTLTTQTVFQGDYSDEFSDTSIQSISQPSLLHIRASLKSYLRKLKLSNGSEFDTEEILLQKEEIPHMPNSQDSCQPKVTVNNLSSSEDEEGADSVSTRSIPEMISKQPSFVESHSDLVSQRSTPEPIFNQSSIISNSGSIQNQESITHQPSIINYHSESIQSYLDAELEGNFIQAEIEDEFAIGDEINHSSDESQIEMDTYEIEAKPLTSREGPMFTNVLQLSKLFVEISGSDFPESNEFKDEISSDQLLPRNENKPIEEEAHAEEETSQNFGFEVEVKAQKRKKSFMSILCPCFFK
ncbi:unnamed protein product [Blepharisma stoltei]|uniref:Uncharacterized protein n=1 Tax=Blepharisma stoltei TaxID=1481888 RepID=A0AAU9IYG2_9CILI|nr:unnamed protein product [Blepharisma stoltei]